MLKESGIRLGLGAAVLMVCTACPRVERKVYTFDLSAIAGDSEVSVGPMEVEGADAAEGEKALGPLQRSILKMCLAPRAVEKSSLQEVAVIRVPPDGTPALTVEESTAPNEERNRCYTEAVAEATFSPSEKGWSIRIPMSITTP